MIILIAHTITLDFIVENWKNRKTRQPMSKFDEKRLWMKLPKVSKWQRRFKMFEKVNWIESERSKSFLKNIKT